MGCAGRLDAAAELRGLADLGQGIASTAQQYTDVIETLVDNGQIAFPARRIQTTRDHGPGLLKDVTRGAWIALPATDPAARRSGDGSSAGDHRGDDRTPARPHRGSPRFRPSRESTRLRAPGSTPPSGRPEN